MFFVFLYLLRHWKISRASRNSPLLRCRLISLVINRTARWWADEALVMDVLGGSGLSSGTSMYCDLECLNSWETVDNSHGWREKPDKYGMRRHRVDEDRWIASRSSWAQPVQTQKTLRGEVLTSIPSFVQGALVESLEVLGDALISDTSRNDQFQEVNDEKLLLVEEWMSTT